MKKKLMAIVVIIVLMMAVVGCGKSNTDKKANSDSADEGKITIWAWDPNFNIAIMEKAKEIYLEDHPKVEIEIVDYAKGDLEQKLHTNLASGLTEGLPDIVLIEDYNAQKYLQSYPGSFEDLTDKLKYSDFAPYKVGLMTLDKKKCTGYHLIQVQQVSIIEQII